jgi:hypothetical protein
MIVAILGAGPAGMSCANASLSFGLTPVVIEQSDAIGGIQLGNFHPNLWLLGEPEETGREMSERMARHFAALPLTCIKQGRITAVRGMAGDFTLDYETPAGQQSLTANAIVLATGTHPRSTPELAALAAESERVIIGPLSETIRDDIRQARVLILGGGDNALDPFPGRTRQPDSGLHTAEIFRTATVSGHLYRESEHRTARELHTRFAAPGRRPYRRHLGRDQGAIRLAAGNVRLFAEYRCIDLLYIGIEAFAKLQRPYPGRHLATHLRRRHLCRR